MGVKSWSDRHRYIREDDQVFHLPRQTKREREEAREVWRVLKMLGALVTVALFLLILIVSDARSAVVGEWRVNLLRGSTTQQTVSGETEEQAWTDCVSRIPSKVASGSQQWKCQTPVYVATVTPDPCPPLPVAENRTQQCPTGTTGDWIQARAYVTAPAPTCAIAGSWQPPEPPADACKPADGDADGVPDATDRCPTEAASTADGCPLAPLTAPTISSATVVPGTVAGRYNVKLVWTALARATSYEIERCTSSGCTSFALLATSTTASYSNTNLPGGWMFRYRVRALEGTTPAPYSAIVDVLTTAAATNTAPVISGTPAATVQAGSAYNFQPAASDADSDALTFSIANKPAWSSFSAATGALTGTATTAGSTSGVTIGVSDGKATATLPAFTLTVVQSSSGEVTLSWNPPTQKTDGTALTNLAGYIVEYGSTSFNLDKRIVVANAGISSYVVGSLAPGTYYFQLRAFDSNKAESQPSNMVSKAI